MLKIKWAIQGISKYNAHTEPLFKSLNLQNVSDILHLQLLKFYYKYKNRTLPYYLAQLPFITQADIHDHSTRAQNKLCTKKPNHEHAKYSIRYHIPKVINITAMEILTNIKTHSLQGFRRYIKHTIIQSYQELCTIQNCYICSRLWSFHIPPNSNLYLTIWYNYGKVFCICSMHIPKITLNSMGLGGGSIYLILCLKCYFSLVLCIYLSKIMLILAHVLFHYNLRSFIVNQTSLWITCVIV